MSADTFKLKNGTEEASGLVVSVMLVINRMLEERPLHLYELFSVAKNREHRPFGMIGPDLVRDGLLKQDFGMHGSIRNIVLSAVSVDGADIRVSSPVAVDTAHAAAEKGARLAASGGAL